MLFKFPVTRLQIAAQQVVFSTLGSTATSLGALWANWAGLIEDFSLLGLSFGGETVVGAGVLAGVIGMRWSVGRWEGAKRKFWADWDRVGKGLGRDLTATLDKKFEEHVTSVPLTICGQLESLGKKRREELAGLDVQVDTLLRDSKNLHLG